MAKQKWTLEPTYRHIRVMFNDEYIADTKNALLLLDSKFESHYLFPIEDVNMDYLQKSSHETISGYKGTAVHWHVKVGHSVAENAAWAYPETKENRPNIEGYIGFVWNAMDAWYEEDEEVFLHPRNPYHRVDAIQSSRHIRVVVDGVTLADTYNPVLVFETGLPTRYYLPQSDVNMDYLQPTDLVTICPYKGFANYWNIHVNDNIYENVVWSYLDPIPELPKVKQLVAFWLEHSDSIEIYVDDELIGRDRADKLDVSAITVER